MSLNSLELLDILQYWNFWNSSIPDYTRRSIDLPQQMSNSFAIFIQGVRRSGKSTLINQVIQNYKLPINNCLIVNFEDPKLLQFLDHTLLDQIVKLFSELRPDQKLNFFFDEIQNVENWEKWLHTRLERPQSHTFTLTGSNSFFLSGELSSVLSGRHISLELYPLSFAEVQLMKPGTELGEYLIRGGFPEPLKQIDGDRLLKQYFDDIIERDIKRRINARSSQSIRQVIQMTFESAGSELSQRKIAGATGLSVDTVSHYLETAQLAYLLFSCQFFAFSERKRARMNKKYYPIDTGLRRCVVSKTGADLGKMLEIAVFIELRKRFSSIYYWRDKKEVDFIVETPKGYLPIQVSWEEQGEEDKTAEINFFEHFPQAMEFLYINRHNFKELSAIVP